MAGGSRPPRRLPRSSASDAAGDRGAHERQSRRAIARRVDGMRKAFGATVAVDDVELRDRSRAGPRAARRERRRQVDDRQAAVRADAARRGQHRASSASRSRLGSPRAAHRARHPDRVPGDDAGPRPDRRSTTCCCPMRRSTARPDPPPPGASRGRGASRRARASTASTSRTRSATSISPCSRRSRSPARSTASRASCCSTSRPPRFGPRRRLARRAHRRAEGARASPSSSSRTACPKCAPSAIA